MTNEQLVANVQAGVDVAENMLQLWQQNQGIIGKIACRYSSYEDIEDLKQQGYIGLCDAVRGYRPEEGTKFITYAMFWIRQSIQRYVEECSRVVRIPSDMRGDILRLRRFCAVFEREAGRKPSDRELSLYLGCSRDSLEQIRKTALVKDAKSLDAPIQGMEDEEITLSDTLSGDADPEAEVMEKVDSELLRELIWPMVDELPGNCPKVIRMRYQGRLTLKETGREIDVNIEAARQLENKALRELRKPSRARKLRPFLDDAQEAAAYRPIGASLFNRTWESSTERAAMRGVDGSRILPQFADYEGNRTPTATE